MDAIIPNFDSLVDFLATCLRLSVPLAFAALGGVIAERSGVYNIGLEGMILWGAFGAALGASVGGTAVWGLAVGITLGALAGALLGILAVTLGVDQIISGIAINLLALGMTAFLARVLLEGEASTKLLPGFHPVHISFLADLPLVGRVLFQQDVLVYGLIALAGLSWWILFHTPAGLSLRALGEDPRAAGAAGIPVNRGRFTSVVISGACAGLAGCYLVLSQVFVFSEHMSAGKGFVALAAVILGRWNPLGALAACLFFGMSDALQLRLQFTNPEVPYQIFVMLPYVASIVALIGIRSKASSSPAAVGVHYRSESK